ncbi:MAG: glycosyltransferase family 4 protein, partial [Verrucomicrobia bacterium]|nr:glycosyltransferase family 4 protein [Verrucomicrobiota bacterium]
PLIHPRCGVKEVVTLHDLALLRYPERFRPWHRHSGRRSLQKLHRANHIICISQFTANEAMALLDLPAAKITVIHNGCDFQSGEPPREAEPAFEIPSGFFLFAGSMEPGKNLSLLKEVYALADARNLVLPPLLIVGTRWVGVGHEGAPPSNWHYLGRQPDEALVYLYRRALALVFPSKYEGFGLPLVEAMALGCPVICSRVASLPEVGGGAAMYADMNAPAYLEAMTRLCRDGHGRDELIVKGRLQAAKFSWKKCAGQVLEVYRSVLSRW